MRDLIQKLFWKATSDQLLISEPERGITTVVYPYPYEDGDYPQIYIKLDKNTGQYLLSEQGDLLDRAFQTRGEVSNYYIDKLTDIAKTYGLSYSSKNGFYRVSDAKSLGYAIQIFGQALLRIDLDITTKRLNTLQELKDQVYALLEEMISEEIEKTHYYSWDEEELYPSDFYFSLKSKKEVVINCSSSPGRLDTISLIYNEYHNHQEKAHRIIVVSDIDTQIKKAKSFQRALIASDQIYPRESLGVKTNDLVTRIL